MFPVIVVVYLSLALPGSLPASDGALAFKIRFAPDVKAVYRLDQLTGQTEPLELAQNRITVHLPGGTGDLFKYTPGPFPKATPADHQ